MKTVAIVGFANMVDNNTIKNSKADEIWTLNHAFKMGDIFPRYDRVFELHAVDWALRKGVYRLEDYERWLEQKHPFPVYMQEQHERFQSSLRYPLEEINQDIFRYLIRDGKPNPYYTSSFGYMVALAIYERKVDRIEIHGIEMSNETEYNYQKPAGELMIGIAMGRNITVVLQKDTPLCKAQLYAYDGVPAADRERAEELLELYRDKLTEFREERDIHAQKLNAGITQEPAGYLESAAYASMYSGGMQYLERQLAGDEYYFGRQKLENDRHKHFMEEEKWLSETNGKYAVFVTCQELDVDGTRTGPARKDWLDARSKMYQYSGARQVAQKLMDECDMRVVPDELRMEIKDDI